ncbi:MAG: hypothetical protein Q8P41_23800 [Pseudomonadota bacterium]|nr:hypothetical protein [Pseudomonadota bacterium]
MILLLASVALASPDRLAATFDVGTTVTDIVLSPDGGWIAWNDAGAGTFTLLNTGTFESTILSACPGARGVAAKGDALTGWTFFAGCSDGTVAVVEVTIEGDISLRDAPLVLGSGPVFGVETSGTEVYAVVDDPTDGAVVAAVTVLDGLAVEGFPVQLSSDTIEDTVLLDDYLLVSHGGDEVSKVILSTQTALLPQSSLGGRVLLDGFPYPDGSDVYYADESGGLVRFEISENDYVASLTNVAEAVTAVAIQASEGWMLLGAGGDALRYSFDGGLPGTLEETIVGAANLTELVALEGYAFGTTSDGTVLVLTDRPWVTLEPVTPSTATDGDDVALTFSVDIAGTYEVRLGGTAEGDGTLLDSGEVDALTPTTVNFTVDAGEDYQEGKNTIWVFVKDAAGQQGRAAGSVLIDNPPEQIVLGPAGVGFGNQAISVSFDALAASDIATYTIYIDVAPFEAADFPSGGPTFTGSDDITAPLQLTAEPGSSVSRTIYPVTNGTTYYVAVRAVDDGGLEGPMSDIRAVTPEETYSASMLAGDKGSFFPGVCGVGPGAGAAAIALALAAVSRRRRFVGGAAVLALAVIATPAEAKDADEGARTMNVQLRYGPTTIVDPYVEQVFGGKANEMLWFEYGYASRFVDANLGIGFYQEMGWLQTESGVASDEHDMLTILPLALTLTGRLDFFEEQPIVPFGRIGLDYWMWKENWYSPDPSATDNVATGGKYGWHYGGGLMLLLDALDRRSASRLEAISGINDTYLVAEYRQTLLVHGADQFDFSSSELTFGLKFDF